MTNATIEKFGFPGSLVAEFEHWLVLARPAQVTLGSLVLAARSDATAYGALPAAAFAEQGRVIAALEAALRSFCGFERINYLMLMMVDPHVHFHALPRYPGEREWRGQTFPDRGWPGQPDLAGGVTLAPAQLSDLAAEVAVHFRHT